MDFLSIFLPHIVYIAGAVVCYFVFLFPTAIAAGSLRVYIFHKAEGRTPNNLEPAKIGGLNKENMSRLFFGLFMGFVLFVYTCVLLFFSDPWLRATPSADWEKKIKDTDTAIILGFGYVKGKEGEMKPGAANEMLLKWTLENTSAETILVQEGVWVAAHEGKQKKYEKQFLRIHRHDDKLDINTFDTAFCALQKMETLGKKKVILIAHDLQLQRTAWDFEKLKEKKATWKDFEFIVPEIPPTPFPGDSTQWRTRFGLLYKFIEMFLSRARDYGSSMPSTCKG
ncbi:MAG: hypothetical protein GY765_17345 [bacterium]|nr:hypothetical protein [bacterium]